MIFYSIGFAIYMRQAVKAYNRLISQNCSNIERIHVRWLNGVACLLALSLVVWLLSCVYSSWVVDVCYQLLLLMMWNVILYYGTRQGEVDFSDADNEEPEPLLSPEEAKESYDFRHELERLMAEEHLYLNPHLTLADLALRVGTNRTYLSNYLNNSLQITFYDYVNGWRMKRVKELLKNSANTMTMLEVAEACGFNSLSTFRRIFHRELGCTFSEYRAQLASRECDGSKENKK